jgi:hypothetical protein
MRLPRTIRLDGSDERVYEVAAAPGEWAVSGAFAFADADPEGLTGKARQAFRNGFLGTASFGWSTFVVVQDIDAAGFDAVIQALAAHFVARYGAPDMAAALSAARGEVEFAASLCPHKLNTLLAVERELGPQGIIERFRVVEPPREADHARIWKIVEDD